MKRVMAAGMVVLGFCLNACVTSSGTMVADTDTFCRYAAGASGESIERCRSKQNNHGERMKAASANRIEGLALLNTPPATATQIAGECKADATKPCAPTDTTGSIPATSRSVARPDSPAQE